jgi:hypothetical protein
MIPAFGTAIVPMNKQSMTWTIQMAHDHLSEARAVLATEAQRTLETVAKFDVGKNWGTSIKREPVKCKADNGVELHHSLAEVVNMAATVERLLDALQWAATSEFSGYTVEACHPTQTSKVGQNDLVLVERQDQTGCRARFEVSDVSVDADGNEKEMKDLVSLGVLKRRDGKAPHIESIDIERWPSDRVFLVVSTEFAYFLERTPKQTANQQTRRIWITAHCRYQRRYSTPTTVVLEVISGKVIPAQIDRG